MNLDYFTLSCGVGCAVGKHNAFDRSLIEAGISNYNLITISSILPPKCSLEKQVLLPNGLLLPTAIAAIFSDDIGVRISSAVSVAIPENSNDIGVIMEHSSNLSKKETEEIAILYAYQSMEDRNIKVKDVLSVSSECIVESPEYHCALAAVSLWGNL